MHTHRTRDERVALGALLREGLSQSDIAKHLGVNRSTICRELGRNSRKDGSYHATHADYLARDRRRASKHGARVLENNESLATSVEALLDPLISPKTVAHLLGLHQSTVYAWLYRSRPDLLPRLPQRGRKRRRYGSKRAKKQGWTRLVRSIDERTRLGWEGDTVKGSTRARLLTHVDQESLYTVADLMPDGTADSVHATLKVREAFRDTTITYDRGSEFALWRMIEEDAQADVYFAHAHAPWERGKNENTNGRLRRVFPKRFDFRTIQQRDLDAVVDLMNHTPRESLSWQMPCARYGKACCVSG